MIFFKYLFIFIINLGQFLFLSFFLSFFLLIFYFFIFLCGLQKKNALRTHLRVSCPLSGISSGGSTGTGSCGAGPPGSFCWHGTCTLSSAERSAWRNFCIPHRWTVRSASRWIYPRKPRTQCAAGSAPNSVLYPPRKAVRCLESARLRSGGGLSPLRSDHPEILPASVPPADLSTRSPPWPWLDCEPFTRLLLYYSRWRRPVVFYPCRRANWYGKRIDDTGDMCPTRSDSQIGHKTIAPELRAGGVFVRKRDNQKPQMNQIRGERRHGVAQPSVGMIDMSMNGRLQV